MRLALVTHKVVRGEGMGRVSYEVAHEALRRGHDVVLVASVVDEVLAQHPGVEAVLFPVDQWPVQLVRNALLARRTAQWLDAHRSRLDVIQADGCVTSAPVDVNTAHFVHSAWLHSPYHDTRTPSRSLSDRLAKAYQWLFTYLNARWERRAFTSARAVVAVSTQVKHEVEALGLTDVHTILNGVDLDEFAPGAVDREALGLPTGVPLALFVGDIQTPRKGLDTVLRALQHVEDLHLAVAGTIDASPFPAMAADLGLADRVHFLGFRRDVGDLMRGADLFVAPSRYEPFSLVVLEAMATGLPVITAQTVGAAELVDEDNGIVLRDPNDVDGLADACNRLVADPDVRRRMGRAARTSAEQHGWSVTAKAYLDLFETLAATDVTPPAPAVVQPDLAL